MTELSAFATAHPWLTFFMFLAAYATAALPFQMIMFCWNRHLRHKNITLHGYPTAPNMDADGDIVHSKQPETLRTDPGTWRSAPPSAPIGDYSRKPSNK